MSVKRPLRIAFLTPEFVTVGNGTGGLSAYVYRISRALRSMGHEPEVFAPGRGGSFNFDGIRIEHVSPCTDIPFKVISKFRLQRFLRIGQTYSQLRIALAISRAFSKREKEKSFDFVHSSDCGSPGLFVRKLNQRPLIVRCSWARDLWLKADGVPDVFDLCCGGYFEQMLIKKADVVYAPSKFVADYYSKKYGLKVETLRPPFLLDAETATALPWKLPKRFLFHFGTLGPIKGTDILAAALPLVWREEPDFTMVWAGESRIYTAQGWERRPDIIEGYLHAWGEKASQVMWLGEIKKPQLFAVLKRADATVLPSRCDNLPNTAIESLSLGIPVIGTQNSSIDELVEPGFSGELVPVGDQVALAKIMLKVWRRKVPWIGSGFRHPAILSKMDPHIAASNLVHLAGFDDFYVI